MNIIYTKYNLKHDFLLFFIFIIFGIFCSALWLFLGEPWELLGDGTHYMQMYNGEVAASPFGYRILTPYLAGFLPWNPIKNFSVITITCLILTTGIVSLYAKKLSNSIVVSGLTCFFWVLSFPFVYYGTTFVRADAPMLLLLAVAFLVSQKGVYPLALMVLIGLGILSHETMLIIIPVLWIDKLLSTNISGGNKYQFKYLILISLFSFFIFLLYRKQINVAPGAISYENGILSMFSYVKNYSGGWIKHCLRVYAAFGPALLYASFYAAPWNSLNRSIAYFSIFLCVSLMTLMATDTLRVMAIFYIPVVFFAGSFVAEFLKNRKYKTVAVFLIFQIIYSYIVYGHLRTFESSLFMNKLAAFFSISSLVFLIHSEYLNNKNFSEIFIRMKDNFFFYIKKY